MSTTGLYIVDNDQRWFLGPEKILIENKDNLFLHGDLINNDTNKLIQRINKIVGVLSLSSKKIYSIGKKTLKEFIPASSKYPRMLVNCKIHHSNVDKYVVIDPLKYVPETKYYHGVISEQLGDIGNVDAENKYLLYRHKLNWQKIHPSLFESTHTDEFKDIRQDFRNINSFSIDPPNSKDIDDLISYQENKDDSTVTIGVHIADPSTLIPVGSKLDLLLFKRGSSVYFKDKTHHMLPEIWATQLCSLIEDENRLGISVFLTYTMTGELLSGNVYKSIIKNHKQYNYDEFEKSINDILVNNKLYKFGKILVQKQSIITDSIYDSHQMVAIYMIEANKWIGELLSRHYPDHVLLRIQDSSIKLIVKEYSDLINKYRSESAQYCFGIKNNNIHHSLNIQNYVHFTSPIRRYPDIIIHRLLGHLLLNLKDPPIISPYSLPQTQYLLNETCKTIKKCVSEMERLLFVQLNPELKVNTHAIILGWSMNKLVLLFNEYNFILYGKMYSNKLIDLIVLEYTDTSITIKNNKNLDQKITFNLGDKINVMLCCSPTAKLFNEKFCIKLSDEYLISLYL
jgi:exoribonuclease R